jgi:Tfp pilus assembly protein PilN
MRKATKVVAWVGAIFGSVVLISLALVIGLMIYADYRNAEQHRQQEKTLNTLKQGLTQDLQDLSKMEIKPMTGDEFRRLNSSPTPASK